MAKKIKAKRCNRRKQPKKAIPLKRIPPWRVPDDARLVSLDSRSIPDDPNEPDGDWY